MKNYVCGICGSEYESLDAYLECVAKCGETLKAEQKAEAEKKRLEEVNAAINRVKEAKKYYEEQLAKFKKEYPTEYELNFGKTESVCPHDCKGNIEPETKAETIELTYEDNGKDKPKLSAKVNGKRVDEKTLDNLFSDPDTRYIAKMLGLL